MSFRRSVWRQKMTNNQKAQLGSLLVDKQILSQARFDDALRAAELGERKIEEYLVDYGFVSEDRMVDILAVLYGVQRVDLRGIDIPQELIDLMPATILRKYNLIPLGYDEVVPGLLIVAMADPVDLVAVDDVELISGCMIEVKIATSREIKVTIDRYYGKEEVMSAAEKYAKEREEQLQQLETKVEDTSEIENAPIVTLVRSMIEQAVRQRASDIHIDAWETQVRVRFRIDGVLADKMIYDADLLAAIVTRIKIMGGMDISEKRKPQDGHIAIAVDRLEYDIRVSILPTSYGEKVVMRLASKTGLTRSKGELGMKDWELKQFERIIANPNGILLVTGPTGSGKSTTLYTALSELNKEEVNIITVEDPVEANIEGVNQVQVNTKADLTFANALRSILRQDPDIIMIGEIRDYETAAIAVQASITGHLVVSTLHTNNAASAFTRLVDMGVEPYLLADSVIGVIAQRLVRRLCPYCRSKVKATEQEKLILGKKPEDNVTIYKANGCPLCGGVGYHGRIGVYEIIAMTPEIRRIVATRGTSEAIKEIALKQGTHTLRMSASEYVLDGTTTYEEMMRVSFEY